MYKIFIVAIFLLSFFAIFLKPELHKPFVAYDNSYKMEEKPLIKPTEKTVIKTVTPKKTTISNTPVPKAVSKTISNSTKKSINTVPKKIEKEIATPVKSVQKEVITPQNPTIKEIEEEQISWNKWHSRIQNKILDDIKMPPVPYGTVFEFSFDVDKYGKITNIYTTSKSRQYAPYAVQYIAPLIRSYQGKEILAFPLNSKRTTTTFEGMFRVAQNSKYSRPEDYNDTERIVK